MTADTTLRIQHRQTPSIQMQGLMTAILAGNHAASAGNALAALESRVLDGLAIERLWPDDVRQGTPDKLAYRRHAHLIDIACKSFREIFDDAIAILHERRGDLQVPTS